MQRIYLLLVFCAAFIFLPSVGKAENGVTDKTILIGASLALTGPQGPTSHEIIVGTKAYLDRVNAAGGVFGRKIEFKTLDDGFNPKVALENTQTLIDKDKIFAILSPLGTPNVFATLPIVEKAGIPELGPIAGGDRLYSPPIKNLFMVRAGFDVQASSLIKLAKTRGYKKISLFRGADSLGSAAKEGVLKAVHEFGLEFAGEGVAPTNSIGDIDEIIKSMQKLNPDVVVLWAETDVSGNFVKRAKELGFQPAYFSGSVVFSRSFLKIAGDAADGLICAFPVPFYKDDSTELAKQFNKDMRTIHYSADPKTYEGYLNAAIFHEALKRAGKDLTREKFIAALNSLNDFKIAGVTLSFSEKDHGGLDSAFPVQYRKGKFYPITAAGDFKGRGF